MGKSSKPKTKTEVIETEMSKEQVKILKEREQFYQNFTKPSLRDYYNATQNFSLNDNFATLDDLTNQLDGIFSDDPEQSQLSRDLFRRGFSGDDIAAAGQAEDRRGAVGREAAGSQARLAAIQQGNQNIMARNQNTLAEQNVRQSGIDSLLSQAPQATRAGTPILTAQRETDGGNAWMGALGGALGAGAGSLFGGSDSGGGGAGTPQQGQNFMGQGMFPIQ